MSEWFQLLYHWIEAHPLWAQILLFAVVMADGLFVIGALVPAGIMLFAMGALVALGAVGLWTTVLVAAAGALTGDLLSFAVGWYYRERLFEWRLLKRYPEAVANGRRFFERHGGKSVFLARFLGPMRAITPSLAGATGLSPWVFLGTDACAALIWAFAFIMPGVAFGASLGLAAEVAGRLALLIALIGFSIWLVVAVTQFASRQMQSHADRWIGAWLDWSRRHRILGRFGIALADPDHPETPVLAVGAVLLFGLGSLLIYVWAAPWVSPDPRSVDVAVFQLLRELHTPWGIAVAQALLQFGEWQVYVPVALAVVLVLALNRKPRASAHWLAALAFAGLIAVGLHYVPSIAPPYSYYDTLRPAGDSALDLVVATVVYGFVPVLVATGRSLKLRVVVYAGGITLLVLTVLARLYLGAQWWSLALFSVVIGGLWSALLAFGYRRHHPEQLSPLRFLLPVGLVFVAAVGWQWADERVLVFEPLPPRELKLLSTETWAGQDYMNLRRQREDITGRLRQPFNLQWAGDLEDIRAELLASGWQPSARLRLPDVLRWLAPSRPIAELPVLPHVHAGRHQALILRRPLDDNQQYLVRLWPTAYGTHDGARIWVGYVTLQEARSLYRVLRYPVEVDSRVPLRDLLGDLPQTRVLGTGSVWRLKSGPDDP